MPTTKKPSAREQLAEYRRKRDFSKTGEPEGGGAARKKARKKAGKKAGKKASKTAGRKASKTAGKTARQLDFVVQKHAATRLHYDLRLELDGVMKSWAVPKGPSADPGAKRLAMQVEDHPIEYNSFEGTIPKGEYGGGTVMLWDQGWYEPEKGEGEDGVREGYRKGDLKVVFHGKRMKGAWVLVRTRGWGGGSPDKPSWLLIKHRDTYVQEGDALTEKHTTSVVSKRTMEQIGGSAKSHVWHSNRPADESEDGIATRRKTISVAEARAARAKAAANTDGE